MRRSRKTKLITMIALVIAIVGMTIGFAAFSSTLTISSSATVTPNDDQLNLKIYGYTEETDENSAFISYYNSETSSNFFTFNNYGSYLGSGTIASIDNDNFLIKDINVSFEKPGPNVYYYFAIKNEGAYDAYINLDELSQQITKTCTPASGTSDSLVQSACQDINIYFELATSSIEDFFLCRQEAEELSSQINEDDVITEEEENTYLAKLEECDSIEVVYSPGSTGSHKIAKGSYIMLYLDISYNYVENQTLADGPFTISFSDIKLDFTTNNPYPAQ